MLATSTNKYLYLASGSSIVDTIEPYHSFYRLVQGEIRVHRCGAPSPACRQQHLSQIRHIMRPSRPRFRLITLV